MAVVGGSNCSKFPLAKSWPSHISSHPENVTSLSPIGWGYQASRTQGAVPISGESTTQQLLADFPLFYNARVTFAFCLQGYDDYVTETDLVKLFLLGHDGISNSISL